MKYYLVDTFWPHRVRGPYDTREAAEEAYKDRSTDSILLQLYLNGVLMSAEEAALLS